MQIVDGLTFNEARQACRFNAALFISQVAMLESSLTESERQAGGCLQERPGSALTEMQNESLSGRQDAAEDTVQLERVRLELTSLMKVAEAGQVALLVKKIADLLVLLSKEGGASGPPAKWGAAEAVGRGVTTNGAVFSQAVGGGARGVSQGNQAGSIVEQSLRPAVRASVKVGRAAADVDEYDSEGSDGGYETEEQDEGPPANREDESLETESPARKEVEQPPSEESEPPAAPAEASEEDDDEDDVSGGVGLAPEAGATQQKETNTEGDGEERGDTPSITLYYETGWETAFVHCSADGQR